MTSPNSVVLKKGTEKRDMQLSQVTTWNLRIIFQVSSGLVIKLHYVMVINQGSARAALRSVFISANQNPIWNGS